MAFFRVVCQKHVVFLNTKLFWAKIWTNGDIPGGLSETFGQRLIKQAKQSRKWILPKV
jgi:hypothetical protein